MALFPQSFIDDLRLQANIVQVIQEYVPLKRAGRTYKGLCPFHGEKTPSFNVVPAKQFFHCFGCQKHGDVFSFVMELEGKSFVEAAEQLAGRFGIAIPRVEEPPEQQRARVERLRMLEINKLEAAFYRETLLGLWIALTLILVVYALVDGSRPKGPLGGGAETPATRP